MGWPLKPGSHFKLTNWPWHDKRVMRKFVKAALTKGEQKLLELSNYESAAVEVMKSGLNFKKAHDLFRIAKNFSRERECLNKGTGVCSWLQQPLHIVVALRIRVRDPVDRGIDHRAAVSGIRHLCRRVVRCLPS